MHDLFLLFQSQGHSLNVSSAIAYVLVYSLCTSPSKPCHHCGCVLPKKEAKISGWDSEHSLRHVHCPRCEKIITHTP